MIWCCDVRHLRRKTREGRKERGGWVVVGGAGWGLLCDALLIKLSSEFTVDPNPASLSNAVEREPPTYLLIIKLFPRSP